MFLGSNTHLFSKIDNVHVHFLLFQTFGQLDKLCNKQPKVKKESINSWRVDKPSDDVNVGKESIVLPHKLTSFSLSSIGLPTKAMILILWFFPCLCFRAS